MQCAHFFAYYRAFFVNKFCRIFLDSFETSVKFGVVWILILKFCEEKVLGHISNFFEIFKLNLQETTQILKNVFCKSALQSGFRIRINFFRIRIQRLRLETNPDPDPDPGL